MPQHVAFLRGINITGRRVKNDDLVACFTDVGFRNVTGFLASGNILFDSTGASASVLEPLIEEALEQHLGYPVPAFVRTASQVAEIQRHSPFPAAAVAATEANMQVALLGTMPTAAQRMTAMAIRPSDDLINLSDQEMYWLPRIDISGSKLDLKALANILGPMTIRTQRTMVRLAEKLS